MLRSLVVIGGACLLGMAAISAALAQTPPAGTLRLIIGYPPGGSADFTARIVADEMGKDLGQAVIVDNRPGAGTMIASDAVAKARPDGQTILLNWHQSIVKALMTEKLPYDPERAFTGIGRIATGANVLVVNSSVQVKDAADLISQMKAQPGKFNAASGGYGSSPHLALAAFEQAAGVKFNTVHYKGGGPAVQSILAGDTQVLFASWPSVQSFVAAKRLRPLLVTTRRGLASVPGVPGADEAGVAGFESSFWFGLFAPAGTPQPVLARLHQALGTALAKAEVRAKISGGGMEVTPSISPQAFSAEVAAEAPHLERLMQVLGARVE